MPPERGESKLIGIARLSKTPFYGGIQTQADGHTKTDRTIRKIGPGLLMSMWGERSLDAITPSIGGLCQSSGHEGDFVSVRRADAWSKGTYSYRGIRMDEEIVEGEPHTWVGAFVYSHQKFENVFIGALRFQGQNLVLSRKVASFVEVYGRRIPVGGLPTPSRLSLPVSGGRSHLRFLVVDWLDRLRGRFQEYHSGEERVKQPQKD